MIYFIIRGIISIVLLPESCTAYTANYRKHLNNEKNRAGIEKKLLKSKKNDLGCILLTTSRTPTTYVLSPYQSRLAPLCYT